jgi:hypothetical protein
MVKRRRVVGVGGDPIVKFYSGQYGSGSLPYFVGKQYGTGWLRTLARIAFPLLKTALGAAGGIASRTAQDLIENRKNFKDSIKDNTLTEVGNLINAQESSSINSPKKKKIRKHHTIFARR